MARWTRCGSTSWSRSITAGTSSEHEREAGDVAVGIDEIDDLDADLPFRAERVEHVVVAADEGGNALVAVLPRHDSASYACLVGQWPRLHVGHDATGA